MLRVCAATRSHNKGKAPKLHCTQMWSAFSIVFPTIDVHVLRSVLCNLPVLCGHTTLLVLQGKAIGPQRLSAELISLTCAVSTGVEQLLRDMSAYDLRPDTMIHIVSKVKELGERAGKIAPGELSALINLLNDAGDAREEIINASTSLLDMRAKV